MERTWMSRRLLAAVAACTCALLLACACAPQPAQASSASLKAKLEAATSGSVYYYSYADYDGDGSKEAFAVCGDSSGGGTITGKIYFVSSKGVVSAVTDTESWWNHTASSKSRATSFKVKGTKTGRVALFHVPHYYAVEAYEWVCGVKSGKPYRSGAGGDGFEKIGAAQYVVSLSVCDASTDWSLGEAMNTGRTFKRYYFKVTKNGVKEYGAISITKTQLKKCRNGTSVLRKLQNKGTVRKIWYRGNGIINVNVANMHSSMRDNQNYTLLLKGNGRLYYYNQWKHKVVKSLDAAVNNAGYGGIYAKAMHPKIASYPKHFKVAGKVVK